jgi:hypothetical protein
MTVHLVEGPPESGSQLHDQFVLVFEYVDPSGRRKFKLTVPAGSAKHPCWRGVRGHSSSPISDVTRLVSSRGFPMGGFTHSERIKVSPEPESWEEQRLERDEEEDSVRRLRTLQALQPRLKVE